MIIGISGKIGSGKDTVGRIIQYLTSKRTYDKSFVEWESISKTDNRYYAGYSNWQIKKYAGKLKQTVSILTGIPIEDLEKQEVKNRVLGEEWLVWKEESSFDKRFKKLHLEEPLTFGNCKKVQYTVRQLLQEVGTNAMREVIHPNIWVNALFVDYNTVCKYRCIKQTLGNPDQCTCEEDCIGEKSNWIITDCIFPNELQAIKNKGGFTIRVNRSLQHHTISRFAKDGIEIKEEHLVKETYDEFKKFEHPSETALDNAKFDYVIDNNGTIEELIEKVREILIKEKII